MKKIITSIFLFGVSMTIYAQGTWVQKNDFNGNARNRGVVFTIANNAYYGTGNHFGGGNEQSDFWVYDASIDNWTSIANFPAGMQAGIGMSIDGLGYAGIGWWSGNAHKDFYEYNPATNTWTAKANYGGNLTNDAVATSYSNLGYVGLGDQPYAAPLNNEFHSYNPTTDTWQTLLNFSGSARRSAVAFEVNGELYAGGGQHDAAPHPTDFYKYNISTNSWTPIATGPTTNATSTRNSAFVIGDNAYLSINGEFWEYNTLSNVWTQYALPFSGEVDAAFTINGKGYVIRHSSKEVWEFSPTETTGINENNAVKMSLHPNPASESIIIKSESCEDVIVMDLLGKVLIIESKEQEAKVIDVSSLKCGTYFVRQGQSVIKIIKN